MAEVHHAVPFSFAQGQDLARDPGLGSSQHSDGNLDLGPVRRVRDDPGSHGSRQAAEDGRIGGDRTSLDFRPM